MAGEKFTLENGSNVYFHGFGIPVLKDIVNSLQLKFVKTKSLAKSIYNAWNNFLG